MLSKESFRNNVLSSDWYQPGIRILCACSGGIDSSVMLHLLQSIPELQVSIVHFDHQLRGADSRADMEFVERLGAVYDCPVHVISEDIISYAKSHKLSLEEAGSRRRRIHFQKVQAELDYDLIATGQHGDDQIETILLNLYLGTGIKGLAGIGAFNDQYIRPLLKYSQAEITEYARWEQLDFRLDKTNTDISILRNNIRGNLIPFLRPSDKPLWEARFQEISLLSTQLQEKLEHSTVVIDNIDISSYDNSKISLGLGKLTDYFSPIQKVIFDRAFQSVSLMPQGLATKHFQALRSLLSAAAIAREIQLPGKVTAIRDRKHITFIKKQTLQWNTISMTELNQIKFPFFQVKYWTLPVHGHVHDPGLFWYKGDPDDYHLRRTEVGDKIQVKATGNRIAVLQILQAAHVAPHLKQAYPVLEHRGEIVWVPGLRTSHSAMIDLADRKENEVGHCFRVEFQKGTFE